MTQKNVSLWRDPLNPLAELHQEVDRLFEEFWSPGVGMRRDWRDESLFSPVCELEESEDRLLITLEMPGVAKEDIRIEVMDRIVRVSAEHRQEERRRERGRWYSERRIGRYRREFALPMGVDPEHIETDYRDGVLRIAVPKIETVQPRQIRVGEGPSRLLGRAQGSAEKGPTEVSEPGAQKPTDRRKGDRDQVA